MLTDDPDMSDMMIDPGPKHSTPVKGASITRTQHSDNSASDFLRVGVKAAQQFVEESVVVQQRKEIALLVAELRERDQELNDLVLSHQHQLSIWEQDRQLILCLQQKCHNLTVELKQQKMTDANHVIRKNANSESVFTSEQSLQSPCSNQSSVHVQQLQSHNENLNDSLKELCTAKGQLQAREQELVTLLQLKEKSLAEAQQTIEDLRAKTKSSELQQKEEHESELHQIVAVWKQHCLSLTTEKDKLVQACKEKDRQLQQATTQLQDTIQQALVLQQALAISCERERNKEELLTSLNSKQDRLNMELNQLRKLYKRQNREMTMLQLTLDTSKESDMDPNDTEKVGVRCSAVSSRSQSLNVDGNGPLSLNIIQHQQDPQEKQEEDISEIVAKPTKMADRASDNESTEDSTQHRQRTANRQSERGSERVDRYIKGVNSSRNTNNSNSNAYCVQSQGLTQRTGGNHNTSDQTQHFVAPSVAQSLDSNEDGSANRLPDVDTDAFWQKILSVRHGNQDNLLDKNWNNSPVKRWLPATEEKTNKSEVPPAGNNGSASYLISREQFEQKIKSSIGLQGKFSTEKHVCTGNSGVQCKRQLNSQQHLTTSSSSPCSQHRQCIVDEIPKRQVFDFHKDYTPRDSLPQLNPQNPGSAFRYFASALPSHTETDHLVQHQSDSHTDISIQPATDGYIEHGVIQLSRDQANADSLFSESFQFDKKLSSFLETPDEDGSYDRKASQGQSSPASRLHHLLIESQEMIKNLEVTSLPDQN